MTDWASELMGEEKGQSQTEKVLGARLGYDYAENLLNPVVARASLHRPIREIDQLPIENKGSNEGTVGFSTTTKGKMVEDPKTRLRIYAKELFPDLPESEALDRIGMVGKDIVYVGRDDKLYRASPEGFVADLKGIGSSIAASSPSLVMGTMGAVGGSGVPGLGTVTGGALGAAGGKAWEKSIANLAFDEPQTWQGNLKDIALEGVFGGGGAIAGKGVAKFLERGVAKDVAKVDPLKTKELQAKSTALGIPLTPAEITDLPSLKGQQKMLAGIPSSADTMGDFFTKRAESVKEAINKHLAGISGVDNVEEAGALARTAAGKAQKEAIQERADAARPLYETAFSRFDDFSKTLRTQNPGGTPPKVYSEINQLIKRMPSGVDSYAKKLAKAEGIDLSSPSNSLKGLHYIKLSLDDAIDQAKNSTRSGSSNYAASLTGLKEQYLKQLDALSPDYAEARKVYAHMSPLVRDLKEGPIGRISQLGDEKLVKVAQDMFNPRTRGPLAVSQARKAIEKSDPEAWQALKRAYIQEEFEKAGQQFATSRAPGRQAGQFWASFGGNKRQMDILREAMTPGEFQAFKDLQQVLEAASRVTDTNSDTAFKLMAQKDFESAATGPILKSMEATRSMSKSILDRIKEIKTGKHAERLAEIVTSPDAMSRLKELKKLSPTDRKWIEGTATLLGISASPAVPGTDDPILPEPLLAPRKQ